MHIFAETKRFILREILPEDEEGLFELDSDPEVHRYLGNKPVRDKEQVKETIRYIRQQYVDNGIGRWAIIEKSTHHFVGWTGLKLVKEQFNHHINYYDLGYRLLRKYWGKGIATETALASLQYGFDTLHLPQIYAMAHTENAGSNQILTKAGLMLIETFELEGIKHNWYKIEKQEWAARKLNQP
ncbi:GNAT family N-acetyltransferase [Rhodocytophaga rosea]|uniref:GNAT family N-acetyltransferase n=1 Tax=Rhodocytophaga rosea TaxID=2704465 RepID=A0A6C0GGW6_9BACT|nr:GNAT family N-acetyltransferase [Rhodocytophaga rosea]QHT67256.1 GNAT family N-acetyltransferase [Rhodocytophaga rosea]